MQRDLDRFLAVVKRACANIEKSYFQLPQAEGDATYRERVYCYELYHQLRIRWGKFHYTLGGEIDKAGHPLFTGRKYARAKPDFLVHCPGDMQANLVILEVKPISASLADLEEDLRKIEWFCNKENVGYFAGVLLVYGSQSNFDKKGDQLVDLVGELMHPVTLLHHAEVGTAPHTLFNGRIE